MIHDGGQKVAGPSRRAASSLERGLCPSSKTKNDDRKVVVTSWTATTCLHRLRGSGNDVAYRNWSAQHAKPKPRDFGRRDGAEPGENEYAIRLHQLAQLTQHIHGMLEIDEIDDHQARLRAGPNRMAHDRPGIGGENVVAFFNELSANERARSPHRSQKHDVGLPSHTSAWPLRSGKPDDRRAPSLGAQR